MVKEQPAPELPGVDGEMLTLRTHHVQNFGVGMLVIEALTGPLRNTTSKNSNSPSCELKPEPMPQARSPAIRNFNDIKTYW
jgi:hypothetical protein